MSVEQNNNILCRDASFQCTAIGDRSRPVLNVVTELVTSTSTDFRVLLITPHQLPGRYMWMWRR